MLFIDKNIHNRVFIDCEIIITEEISFTNCSFHRCVIVNRFMFSQLKFIKCEFDGCYFDLIKAKIIDCKGLPLHCPETGSFIGYKKAIISYDVKSRDGAKFRSFNMTVIVKLEIPEDALRSSAFGTKCRCSKAKVLSITDDELKDYEKAHSIYQPSFTYTVGETVEVNDFDTDRWNECSTGIHFFMTKQEAIDY